MDDSSAGSAGAFRWLRRSEKRWRHLKLAGQLVGGVLAAWGGGMGGDLLTQTGGTTSPTWKMITLMGGVLLLIVVGVMTFFDRDPGEFAELADQRQEALSRAVSLAQERDALSRTADAYRTRVAVVEERAQLRVTLHQVLLQAVETASLQRAKTPAKIQMLLEIATDKLLQALTIERQEDWTISVFQRKPRGKADAMVRIAQKWAAAADAKKDKRVWFKAEGYTGAAWETRKPVIVDDARSAIAKGIYHVPPEKRVLRDDVRGIRADVERYVSAASFPIRVGPANPRDPNWQPWGIITVTTDRPGLFSHEDSAAAGENREVVRYLAALIALIVAGNGDFIEGV